MKVARATLLIAIVGISITATAGETADGGCMTVADYLLNGTYTYIEEVLDLLPDFTASVLGDPDAELTVWVPDDDAFVTSFGMSKVTSEQLLVPKYADILQMIVDAHIVPSVIEDLESVSGDELTTTDPNTKVKVDAAAGTVGASGTMLPLTSTITDEIGVQACKSIIYPITDYLIVSEKVAELMLRGLP